jgi:hypothetical protein
VSVQPSERPIGGLYHWRPGRVTRIACGIADVALTLSAEADDAPAGEDIQLHTHSCLFALIVGGRVVKSCFTADEINEFNGASAAERNRAAAADPSVPPPNCPGGWQLLPDELYRSNVNRDAWVYTACYACEGFSVGGLAFKKEWRKGDFWEYPRPPYPPPTRITRPLRLAPRTRHGVCILAFSHLCLCTTPCAAVPGAKVRTRAVPPTAQVQRRPGAVGPNVGRGGGEAVSRPAGLDDAHPARRREQVGLDRCASVQPGSIG